MDGQPNQFSAVSFFSPQLADSYIIQALNQHTTALNELSTTTLSIQQQFAQISNLFKPLYDSLTSSCQGHNQTASKRDVLKKLNASDFPYNMKLKLAKQFPKKIVREKSFNLVVQLESLSGVKIEAEGEIPIETCFFTCEKNPQPLLNFSINAEFSLRYCPRKEKYTGCLRLKLRKTTSRYYNGWVFIAVCVDPENELVTRFGVKVKPLIIRDLIVKAK